MKIKSALSAARPSGFSLVEVVLALGVVSFALLAILGVFGGMASRASDNFDRRSMQESVDALRSYLDQQDFDIVFAWVRDGQELLYVTYWADDSGEPDTSGSRLQTTSRWMTLGEVTADMETAREGQWVRARLAVSPSNPGGITLPATVSDYDRASLVVLSQMDAVPTTETPLPERPRLQTTLAVLR